MSLQTSSLITQLTKLARIFGGLSLMAVLIIAGNSLGDGSYEVSIYQAYDPVFWILLSITLALGFTIIFAEIYANGRTYRWVYGLFLVVTANALLLSLPILRDYFLIDQWDNANHLRFVSDVLNSGKVGSENFYPISHVLTAAFVTISGTATSSAILIFPLLFYIFYLTNTAFLALSLKLRPSALGMTMALASILVFSTYSINFRPVYFTVLMLPLVVGLMIRARAINTSWTDRLLFVLVLFFVVFLHPLAFLTITIIMIIFGLAIAWRGFRRIPKIQTSMATPLFILVIAWLTWFMTFTVFGSTVHRVSAAFIEGVSAPRSIEVYSIRAESAGLSQIDLMSLIVFTYGPMLFLLSLAGLTVVWSLVQRHKFEKHKVVLLACAVSFLALAVLSLFRDLITGNPIRYANFALVAAPMLVGGILYKMAFQSFPARIRLRRLIGGVVLVTLITAAILSVFTIYFSPFNGQPSHQYPYAQRTGLALLVEKAVDDDALIYSPFRGASTLSGVLDSEGIDQLREKSSRWYIRLAPDNLDFAPDDEGIVFENPGYLWVTAHEEAYYTEVWPEGGRINPKDFQKLRDDPNWHQVYVSGGITIWRRNLIEEDSDGDNNIAPIDIS